MKKLLSLLLVLTLMFSMSITALASSDHELDEILTQLDPYVVTTEKGTVYFNTQKAREDNTSEYIMEIGRTLNQFSADMQKNSGEAVKTYKISLPIWGNWCGPGHSGPEAPIDTLDAQCKKHDLCYGREGYFACSCDIALIKNIAKNFKKMGTKEKIVAAAVTAYFTAAPCNPF
ncbi:hypothetical protein [Clostridium sp. E02]|uniref:hypothetical protein n=1 Tax=Clostridium sp. E02 TaxID=2487134 RepID=UPI0019D306E1|nr:hypothetical protein [Clostridium sp. E02]